MKTLTTILLSLFLSFSVMAEEHSLGHLKGTDIDLKTFDHAFAGQIRDFVTFGWVNEETFTSELTIRKYLKTTTATFKKSEKGIGGILATEENSVDVQFLKIDKENNIIKYNVNGKPVNVQIAYEHLVDGHFINPTFTTFLEGKDYTYRLQGEACYGLALHYNMMILAALLF